MFWNDAAVPVPSVVALVPLPANVVTAPGETARGAVLPAGWALVRAVTLTALRSLLLVLSASHRAVPSAAIPVTPANQASVPVPSALPADPDPAMLVQVPSAGLYARTTLAPTAASYT